MLHLSYLHKATLTLFQFIIIDNLPFNPLQVPGSDFLFRMRQDSNLRWTCVDRLTVYCLRPLGNAYIFQLFQKISNFRNKSFWIIKNLFPRFSYFQPSFFFKKLIFFNISFFLFLKSFVLFTINFNIKFSVCRFSATTDL